MIPARKTQTGNWLRLEVLISRRVYLPLLLIFVFAGCSQLEVPSGPAPSAEPRLGLTPLNFQNLPEWQRDTHADAFATFLRTCPRINRIPSARRLGNEGFAGTNAEWQKICRAASEFKSGISNDNARRFFESWFNPYQLRNGPDRGGLFTGYFEPELRGARKPSRKYNVALYRRPTDLVSADLGQFRSDWKGRQVSGRLKGKRLVPYAKRANIERGALKGKGLELIWVDSAIDAFFLHIQGSGRIVLENGEVVRVGFAGRNGQPYFAIGRDLVAQGAIAKEDISLQTIRAWLERNPSKAVDLMNKNQSYVFFREIKSKDGRNDGPIGAAGVPLTAGRSLAVDRKFYPMGAPMWLDTSNPITNAPIRRLMVAQDTGGAIIGPVRGDFFWGAGDQAREAAGRMKQTGHLYILLPRSLRR